MTSLKDTDSKDTDQASKLIGEKFRVCLLNQKEEREPDETATLLEIDSGLCLFLFETKQERVWVPLAQIASLKEIPATEAPGG